MFVYLVTICRTAFILKLYMEKPLENSSRKANVLKVLKVFLIFIIYEVMRNRHVYMHLFMYTVFV